MIAKFALFDMLNFVTPVRRVAPALILVVVAPAIAPWPAFGIGAAVIVMSLLASNPFATDERGRLDTLYATLPMTRRTTVFGRYLALVLLYVVVALLATAAAAVVEVKEGQAVDLRTLGLVNVVALLVYIVALAVQLPFFFSVGFTRARLMTFVPSVVVGGGFVLASQLGLLNGADIAAEVAHNLTSLWIGGAIAAVAALVASIAISSVRYGRRAL